MTHERSNERHDERHRARGKILMWLVAACFAAFVLPGADAGELTLSWNGARGEVTEGYEVEVLDADGKVVQILDAGRATRLVVPELLDGETYGFRVRPYDRFGNRATRASETLTSYPAPRVEEIAGELVAGTESWLTVSGANFANGARAVSGTVGVEVLETLVSNHGEALVRVRSERSLTSAEVDEALPLTFVNPVRKAPGYAAAHPEIADTNGDGRIDAFDIAAVVESAGSAGIGLNARPGLDLTGDGVVDERDVAIVKSLEGRRIGTESLP